MRGEERAISPLLTEALGLDCIVLTSFDTDRFGTFTREIERTGTQLDAALGKIGSPYSWGANGPDSFDCSGFTSYAFKAAGVSLPRVSRAQAGAGKRVSRSDLKPGDLVFYYSPISHVAIYVGNGKIIHSPRPGKTVSYAPVDQMPFNTAARVL